jgi:tRNA (guanine-N7-)-methyltransferase
MRARGSFQPQAIAACLHLGREPGWQPPSDAVGSAVAARLGAEITRSGPWEVELGFGKGRYLLARAASEPAVRFLGIELVAEFFRLAARRATRRGLANVVLLQAEALYTLDVLLPRAFARAIHVYFPDPWPKARHQKRRLFDVDTLDLLLGALTSGGSLFFASDHLEYAARVEEVLRGHPLLRVELVEGSWPEGPRTNYEAKYVAAGRPIRRLIATLDAGGVGRERLLHPDGARDVLVAWHQPAQQEAMAPTDVPDREQGTG